jgi:hypothetical protein
VVAEAMWLELQADLQADSAVSVDSPGESTVRVLKGERYERFVGF